ncbi:hydrolase [Kordiimonas sediminis]|uniref:Hydrolase n=1 Tax=Kordiimonas sediminis TaxID=1735581 RepID=A0A919EAL3_9PROT|nr:alpha/beta hydrolase [Kordiimonas sediminis]GHF30461.1 hydrolase [Kordiimonas sediminis]
MSIRAWLVRQKIKKAFRSGADKGPIPDDVNPDELVLQFRDTLTAGEALMPQPPEKTEIISVDENGIRGEWVHEPGVDRSKVVFYCHGGGYVWGSPKVYRYLAWRLSIAANARVFLLDYSLAPESKYPVQVNEALAAYAYVCDQVGGSQHVALGGDSAGGNLAYALAHAVKDKGADMPASIALLSPWLDMSGSGESAVFNADKEVMLDPRGLGIGGDAYHGRTMERNDPRCSPLFADQKGMSPVLMQVGSTEILLSDSTRLADQLKSAGVAHELQIWKNMHHVWQMASNIIPEGRKAIKGIGAFYRTHWA